MIYKFIGAESSEELIKILKYFIEDGSIKASDPRTFNDPSEFKILYDFDSDDETIRQRYFSDNPKASQEDFHDWSNSFTEHNQWYIGYSNRQEILNRFGVICFTTDPTNYLMWSHYASSHTGFCIGFDDKILNSINTWQCQGTVTYTDSVPVFNYYTQKQEDYIRSIFLNKSTNWKYEKEWRIVTDGHGIKKFDKSLVKEIIIGCKAPSELDQYVRLLIDSQISIFHMIDIPNKYELKKERIERHHYPQKSAL